MRSLHAWAVHALFNMCAIAMLSVALGLLLYTNLIYATNYTYVDYNDIVKITQ
jgi:hypothetical protein